MSFIQIRYVFSTAKPDAPVTCTRQSSLGSALWICICLKVSIATVVIKLVIYSVFLASPLTIMPP